MIPGAPSTHPPARVARIGMASFAHGHAYSYAAALAHHPAAQIVGVFDEDPDRGRAAAEQYNVPYHASLDDLLAAGLDGLIICSENAKHVTQVTAAAGRVKHILCEKPIATTRKDALAMIAACAQHGTHLQIAFPVRFLAPIRELKQRLEAGEIGAPICVKCTNQGLVPGGWFVDRPLSGGGAVLDHTVHVIDVLRWLWHTEVTEVYAEIGGNLFHRDNPIDDAGLLTFQLANGVYGTLDTSWSRPPSYPTWGNVAIEVTGERGIITVDALNQNLALSSNASGKQHWVHWGTNMDHGLIADFVDMIQTGRAPNITGEDGLRALEVALAAYASSAAHQPIVIDHVPV